MTQRQPFIMGILITVACVFFSFSANATIYRGDGSTTANTSGDASDTQVIPGNISTKNCDREEHTQCKVTREPTKFQFGSDPQNCWVVFSKTDMFLFIPAKTRQEWDSFVSWANSHTDIVDITRCLAANCPNAACDNGETCSTCPADCGPCCTPNCTGKNCGSNGCPGGFCGPNPDGSCSLSTQSCNASGQCSDNTCGGSPATNSTPCPGDTTSVPSNTFYTVVGNSSASCTAGTKCESYCNTYFHKNDSACDANQCSSMKPTNSSLCLGGQNTDVPTDQTAVTLSTTDTCDGISKCQAKCNAGWHYSSGSCVEDVHTWNVCGGGADPGPDDCLIRIGVTVGSISTGQVCLPYRPSNVICHESGEKYTVNCGGPTCPGVCNNDGVKNGSEQCDSVPHCNFATCQCNSGYVPGTGNSCTQCGNHIKDSGEQCDSVLHCNPTTCQCDANYHENGNACDLNTYLCLGSKDDNAVFCPGDGSPTASIPFSLLASSAACTAGLDCETYCGTGYYKSGNNCVAYQCTGNIDNATLCNLDDQGLSADTARTAVDACTGGTLCEMKCDGNYHKNVGGTACDPNICSGLMDPNALLCTGDDTAVPSGTAYSVVASAADCSATKCETYCKNTHYKSGNSCLPLCGNSVKDAGEQCDNAPEGCNNSTCMCNTGYAPGTGNTCEIVACSGTRDNNAELCTGDGTSVFPVGTSFTLVGSTSASCTDGTKCETYCKNGYYKSGSSCMPYKCTGSIDYATLCNLDDQGLSADTARTAVDACTTGTLCEMKCNTYFHKNGSGTACVPYQCTGNIDNATLCNLDDQGLSADTPLTAVDACTSTLCEMKCNTYFHKNGSGTACVPYQCTGNIDNATLCNLDDQSLSADTARKAVDTCTPETLCEMKCNTYFHKNGSACNVNLCNVAATPTNSYFCITAAQSGNITVHNQAIVLSTLANCDGTTKCQAVCQGGYHANAAVTGCDVNACAAAPTHASLCSNPQNTEAETNNKAAIVVTSCDGTTKCQATCASGWHPNGAGTGCDQDVNACAAAPTHASLCPSPQNTEAETNNKAAIVVTSCDGTTKCQATCASGWHPNGAGTGCDQDVKCNYAGLAPAPWGGNCTSDIPALSNYSVGQIYTQNNTAGNGYTGQRQWICNSDGNFGINGTSTCYKCGNNSCEAGENSTSCAADCSFACTGSPATNSSPCAGAASPNVNTPYYLVGSCTGAACQTLCNSDATYRKTDTCAQTTTFSGTGCAACPNGYMTRRIGPVEDNAWKGYCKTANGLNTGANCGNLTGSTWDEDLSWSYSRCTRWNYVCDPPGAQCNNGVCESGENSTNCPSDCHDPGCTGTPSECGWGY